MIRTSGSNAYYQTRSEEVGNFLERVPADRLYLTDFTLHSIGIVLVKLGEAETLLNFVKDVLTDSGVRLAGVGPDDMKSVIKAGTDYKAVRSPSSTLKVCVHFQKEDRGFRLRMKS